MNETNEANVVSFFEYEFKLEWSYINTKGGEPAVAKKITIKAPCGIHRQFIAVLEKEYSVGTNICVPIFANKERDPEREKIEKVTTQIEKENSVWYIISNGDISKCFEALKKIFTLHPHLATCKIDDTESLTGKMFDDIPYVDLKKILINYILNFIASSQDV